MRANRSQSSAALDGQIMPAEDTHPRERRAIYSHKPLFISGLKRETT